MNHRRTYQVGSSTLSLQFGDILLSDADVLVSSDDYMLSMGGGVSASIAEAAGSALELDATKAIPRQLGDVVVTTAGALAARYVLHVVTIGPSRDEGHDLQLVDVIERATMRCLELLPLLDVRSIAFPALGTGVAGVSTEDAAVGMAAAALSFLGGSTVAYDVQLRFRPRDAMRDEDYISFFEVFAARLPSLASRRGAAGGVRS